MSRTGETGLLLRVLSDAERRAADGCFREAVVLLRWAARIVNRERLPLVLLAYHRILDIERASGAQERVELRSQTIPLPQFPEVAPTVERNAFVPVQEVATPLRRDSTMVNRPPLGRRARHRDRWITLMGLCGALALIARQDGLHDLRPGIAGATGGHSDVVPSEAPGHLLLSARESIVSGDSMRARAHLRRVLADPRTSVAEYAEAAGLLIGLGAYDAPTAPLD